MLASRHCIRGKTACCTQGRADVFNSRALTFKRGLKTQKLHPACGVGNQHNTQTPPEVDSAIVRTTATPLKSAQPRRGAHTKHPNTP